jgi:hypothetical protein
MFKESRTTETIQGLCDLGYLNKKDIENNECIEKAVRSFRTEYENINLLDKRYSFYNPNQYSSFAQELNTVELDLLHNLTSLDGDFEIQQIPKYNEVGIISRVIHFRLNIYGLFATESPQKICEPFSIASENALAKLNTFYKQNKSKLELINLLGDLPKTEQFIVENVTDSNKRFIYIVKNNKYTLSSILKNNSISEDYHFFLSRVYQLFLWSHGFYNGKIDSELGVITEDALGSLLEIINNDSKLTKNRSLILQNFYSNKTFDGFNILNFVDLIRLLPHEYLDNVDGNNKPECESVAQAILSNQEALNTTISNTSFINLYNQTQEDNSLVKRIYYGAKRIIKLIPRFFKFIKDKIIDKIIDKVKEWSDFIKNIVIILFKEIRTGLTIFLHGLKFLFNPQPIANETLIISNFSLDFDNYNFINTSTDIKTIHKHINICNYFVNSLQVSLGFTGVILHTILYSWAGAWSIIDLYLLLGKEFKQYKKTRELYLKVY